MGKISIRYGSGTFDLRSGFLKLCGLLQGKKVVILNSDPKACGEVLAASVTKGAFIEQLLATPAWKPISSVESVDGETWEALSKGTKNLIQQIQWRARLRPIVHKYVNALSDKLARDDAALVDSECLTRLTLRIMYELVFEHSIKLEDETLFYKASIEWRKEIGMKGKGDPEVKQAFWTRLGVLADESRLKREQLSEEADLFLSTIAQPFLISPQINVSDIMVSVFSFLRAEPQRAIDARRWAAEGDHARLGGILMEAVRLKHPFPVLERELMKDTSIQGKIYEAHTQFFILLDKFEQDQKFDPERWLQSASDNPYHSIPFGAGARMCLGKPIAMELLVDLLQAFLTQFPDERVQPSVGHLYSGRDNDRSLSLRESFYQLRMTLGGLWQAFLLGRRASKPAPAVCPWKGMQTPEVQSRSSEGLRTSLRSSANVALEKKSG